MDIQDKIAARRKQLASENVIAQEQAAQQQAEYDRQTQIELKQNLERLARETTEHGFPVIVKDDNIAASAPRIPIMDYDQIKAEKLSKFLKREARKLWTPGQNWKFFLLLGAGLYLLPFYGLGLLFLLGAWLNHRHFQKQHKEFLREAYLGVFGGVS